ncbi:hypothetical protein D3C84_1152480 [compost metagenome]
MSSVTVTSCRSRPPSLVTTPSKSTRMLLPPSEASTAAVQALVTEIAQRSKSPSTKSFNCAVSERELRVSARKLLKQGTSPPISLDTLMPPS